MNRRIFSWIEWTVPRWFRTDDSSGHRRTIAPRLIRSRAILLLIIAIAAHFSQPMSWAQSNADEFVDKLAELRPHAEVAPTILTLLDGIRKEGRGMESQGPFGVWVIDYAKKSVWENVDPNPRDLSLAASRALANILGDAFTTFYRSNALIPLGDDPSEVFATVDLITSTVNARIIGQRPFHAMARSYLCIVAEQTIVGIPGSPPCALGGDPGALLRLIDSVCVDAQRLGDEPRRKGLNSQQDLAARSEEFSPIMKRFTNGLVALRGSKGKGGFAVVLANPAKWKSVSRGYPDSMEAAIGIAREAIRYRHAGGDELSGDKIAGLPRRDMLEHLAETASEQIRISGAMLGSLVGTSSRAGMALAVGELQNFEYVWSVDGAPVMACSGTVVRAADDFALVFGPITSVSWRARDSAREFGPIATDALAGAVLRWAAHHGEASIHPPVIKKGVDSYWLGGGRWGWSPMAGFNDPAPSWIQSSDRVAALVMASASAGCGEIATSIRPTDISLRLHYDFRGSGYAGITEFDRDARVEVFANPKVMLVDPSPGAVAAMTIGSEIRLDVFPHGDRSRHTGPKSALELCEFAPDRVEMQRVVQVDAGVIDSAEIAKHSSHALAVHENLYAFLLDEADFRQTCQAADNAASARVFERLCRQLGLGFDHPFRMYLDEKLRTTTSSNCDSVTRSAGWLRRLPDCLRHPRLRSDSIAEGTVGGTQ
jgi:hypothetical protein